ncbi:Helix-turn-helix domain-containing protein [Evansella caseinilytica]|uniref:Helix-turn-helix domain-containing protein n=1 Tax=Evansella caseinilytica TaxID=1503961 RepID=A0A1H3IN94_9BACI|nr:AraC family transcriptional regulator [Evansella caseinilytica]SDY29303.1 Helix-turn-helix domain-containing protein [Evansella caseinilytica]
MTEQYSELDEVIAYIHRHIDEPLPLARLAKYAAYSPFHFSRLFKEKIGLSPLYYVSSLRLQKAKKLLLHTQLSVRDIALEIGQQSLGTFTTRFTERVGMTPAHFRNSVVPADTHFRSLQRLDDWSSPHFAAGSGPNPAITGTVSATATFHGVILIGLFPKPIPEGFPLYGTLVSSLGDFCFTGVKPGTYYLMATSVAWEMNALDFLLPNDTLRARLKAPIIVESYRPVPHQQLILSPPRLDDPPILISLAMLMNNFLNRVRRYSN